MGGFARRTSYWNAFGRKYPSRPFLRIDGGSVFTVGLAETPVVNRWMLEGTWRSHLDAINLTGWDLPAWMEMADLAGVGEIPKEWLDLPLVSANVKSRVPNFPAIQRYLIREPPLDAKTGRKLRIGITGLVFDPEHRISSEEFEVTEPAVAAKQVIGELSPKTDYRVVLTDTDIGKAISLAVQVPKINLIVVAHNYEEISEAQQVGETLIAIPANEGRLLSEVRMALGRSSEISVESRFVQLDRTVPDDAAMAELIRKAQAAVDEFKRAVR
jgi:hypothetical protein